MPLKRGGEGKSSDHISRCGVEAVHPLAGNLLVSSFPLSTVRIGGGKREKKSTSCSEGGRGVSFGKNTLPAAHGNKIGHSAPIWLVCFH